MTSLTGSSAMAVEAVPEMASRLSQEPKLSGKSVLMKQVQGQAKKSVYRSVPRSGPAITYSALINWQAHSDKTGPRSNQEVSLQIRVQNNMVHVQAQT